MEPINYHRNFFFLLLLFAEFNFIKGDSKNSLNELDLKFINLPKPKLSGIRNKSLYLNCTGQNESNNQELIKYNWLHNGKIIDKDDQRFNISLNGTVLEIRRIYINIKNGSRSDGKYNCLLSNSFGTLASRNILVIPLRFKNSNKKKAKKINVGENTRLICDNISPVDDVWYSWKFNNEPLQETHSVYTLINSSVLHIVNASKSNEGYYTCNAYNGNQVTSSKTYLKVDYPKDDFKYLKFLTLNKTVVNAQFDQIVTLECLINLARSDAVVLWHRYSNKKFFLSNTRNSFSENNISKLGKRKSRKKYLSDHVNNFDENENLIEDNHAYKRYTIVGESNLQIENVNEDDEDIYFCTASYKLDELNITDHTIYRLNVLDLLVQVTPVKQKILETFVTKMVKFDCGIVYALPKPKIQWLKNGLPIEINSRIYVKSDLAAVYADENLDKDELIYQNKRLKLDHLLNSQLVISDVVLTDMGYYQCFVDSKLNSLTNDFSLIVYSPSNQPFPPKNIMVNVIGSNEAIVNWSIPLSFIEIFGYTIHYHGLNNKMAREIQNATNKNFIHLNNLLPYTNYSLFIRAYSKESVSNDSESYIFLTGEETPVDLPFLKVYVHNKSCVLLKWEPLLDINSRGKILYYRIDYVRLLDNESKVKTINVESDLNDYVICDLLSGEKYKFKIIAGNSKGLPSEDLIENVNWEIIELPLIDYDKVKINLNATLITSNSIQCNWYIYETNNTDNIEHLLKEIILTYNEIKSFGKDYFIKLPSNQHIYNITNLNSSTLYFVKLSISFKKSDVKLYKKIEVETILEPVQPILPVLNYNLSFNSETIISSPTTFLEKDLNSSQEIFNTNHELIKLNVNKITNQNTSNSILKNFLLNDSLHVNFINSSKLSNSSFFYINQNIKEVNNQNELQNLNYRNLDKINLNQSSLVKFIPNIIIKNKKKENLTILGYNSSNIVATNISTNDSNKKINLDFKLNIKDDEKNDLIDFSTDLPVKNLDFKNQLNEDRIINKRKENISQSLITSEKRIYTNLQSYNLNKSNDLVNNLKINENNANEEKKYNLNKNQTDRNLSILELNEDNLIFNLTDQDKDLKIKLENFMNSKKSNISENLFLNNSIEKTKIKSNSIFESNSSIDEVENTVKFNEKILQILKNNLTDKNDLLPSIYDFNVTAINSTCVICKWKTDYLPKKVLFTVYYNPIHYLESNNYQKNFDYEDEFLFIRTNETEIIITNLLPFTVYNFFVNINYKSEDEEDFYYQLDKFLIETLKNKFYIKHSDVKNLVHQSNSEEDFYKSKNIILSNKYNARFKSVEILLKKFENLLNFYKGQRCYFRTLEDLPSSPTEFTGIALDANSIQLSWKMPEKLNGIITNYILFYIKNNRQTIDIEKWKKITLSSIDFSIIVKNLSANSEYKFIIKAENSAGIGKQSTKLIIQTLQEIYNTHEKFLTVEPESNLNTFKYTKYEGITYKDIFLQDETNEILIRIGIGIICLFFCILVIGLCNKIITPTMPKLCKCKSKKCKSYCRNLQLNDMRFKKNRLNTEIVSTNNYINYPYSVAQTHPDLIQNMIDCTSFTHGTNLIKQSHIQNKDYSSNTNINENQENNIKGVKVEIHNSYNSNLEISNKTKKKLPGAVKIDPNLIKRNLQINSINSTNDSFLSNSQNMNFQLNLNDDHLNNEFIYENFDENDSQSLIKNQENILSSDKFLNLIDLKKNVKKFKVNNEIDRDQDCNIPLLNQNLNNIEIIDQGYRLVPIIYENSSSQIINNYTQSLNSNVRKTAYNCNNRNGKLNRNNCNKIESNDEINILSEENKRKSFV